MPSLDDILKFGPKLMEGLGIFGIVGTSLIFVGLSILTIRYSRVVRDTKHASVTSSLTPRYAQLRTRTIRAIGDITISESNEEQRRKIALLRERYTILNDIDVDVYHSEVGGGFSFPDLLEVVQELLRLPSDYVHREARLHLIRDEKLIATATFSDPVVEHCATGVRGMTYLIDGQDDEKSIKRARTDLLQAIAGLEQAKSVVPANFYSALGVCSALKMRDRPVTSDHDDYAIEAHKQMLRTKIDATGRMGPYIFLTNHVEWCAEVYHMIAEADDETQSLVVPELNAYFRSGSDQERLFDASKSQKTTVNTITILFSSGWESARRAFALAKEDNESYGRLLPAIHLHTAILIAGYLDALDRKLVTPGIGEKGPLTGGEAAFHLHQAINMWRPHLSNEMISKKVSQSQCLASWAIQSDELLDAYKIAVGQAQSAIESESADDRAEDSFVK